MPVRSMHVQAPILLPAGQSAIAELERERRCDRVGPKDAGLPVGDIDFGAVAARVVEERHSECRARLLEGHAEGEGVGVRWLPPPRGPQSPNGATNPFNRL